jgi:hypothetical protein
MEGGVSHRRLCVGLATYDDFDGVWFTIQAICMYQAEVLDDVSFLVIDNHPEGDAGPPLKELEAWLPNYHYVPFDGYRGTAVRDLVFREACADIVCCVDSRVLLRPGALAHLLEWFGANPESKDLLQGPLLHDSLEPGATHLEPAWGAGRFGQRDRDDRIDGPGGEPFEIEMQDLGVFACRREAWPGLNPRLRGFGGEEGYLHEKFRQRGGRVLCDPRLGWLRCVSRPADPSYPNAWEDRIRNYHIAWSEIGWDLAPVRSHFRELLGPDADALLESAREEAEHPLNVFDGVFHLAGGAEAAGAEAAGAHADRAGISWRLERLVPDRSLGPEQRRLAGWREAVRRAGIRRYRHMLLLDDCTPADGVSVPSLSDREWDLCLLPTGEWNDSGALLALDPWCSQALIGLAVAVHERAYQQLLADLPADEADQAEFLSAWGSLDGYLVRNIAAGAFTTIAAITDKLGDRPQQAAGIEVVELDDGLMVRQGDPPRAHQLNNTASVVLDSCDGQRTVAGIAAVLAEAFGLHVPPLAEAAACVEELRQAGVLADGTRRPASARLVPARFTPSV